MIRFRLTIVLLAVVMVSGGAHAGSLTTTFVANNGQAGNMFDVNVLGRPMTVTDLEINVGAGQRTLRVYYRPGTWVGNATSAAGWILHTEQNVIGQGNNNVTSVDIPDLPLDANTDYGFYVTLTGGGMRYTNGTGVGNVAAANGDLINREGSGKSYAFGATFQPRIWNGTFIYEIYEATIAKTVDITLTSTPNDLLTYTINVENTGDTNLTGIAIADQLAQGASTSALAVTGPATDTGTAGALDVGEIWTFTATHNVTQAQFDDGGDLVNTARLSGTELGPDYANDTATTQLDANPGIGIAKNATLVKAAGNVGAGAQAGDTINYTYEVSNNGNQTLTDVDIADTHNATTPLSDPAAESLTTDVVPIGNSTDATSNNGIWSSLAPGDTVTFETSYTVTQDDIDLLN